MMAAAAGLAVALGGAPSLPTSSGSAFSKERLSQPSKLRTIHAYWGRSRTISSAASGGRKKYMEQQVEEALSQGEEEVEAGVEERKSELASPGLDKESNGNNAELGVAGASQQQLGYSAAKKRIEEELEKQRILEKEAASAKRNIEAALAKQKELDEKQRALELKRKEQVSASTLAREKQQARQSESQENRKRTSSEEEGWQMAVKKKVSEDGGMVLRTTGKENKRRQKREVEAEKSKQGVEAKKKQTKEVAEEAEAKRKLEEEARKCREEAEANKRLEVEAQRLREEAEAEAERLREEAERKKRMDIEAALERKWAMEVEAARERERIEQRRKELTRLAHHNAVTENKMFYYPLKVEAGSSIQIYLNCRVTALANQKSVWVMGAYNNWQWQSFNTKLERSELPGDWWSCTLEVPKEAYIINFVFLNGEDVYENNETKDFFIPVFGDMDEKRFQNFLIEEKRKEAERIALEQAEKERAAREAHRLAEFKAADEADRAESKRIVAEQREKVRKVLQKAVKRVEGLWDFEPFVFQGGETVRLFYNTSGRPLASSSEVWIHGGYNNWQEAVSFARMLSPSASRGGSWWSVELVVPKEAFLLNWVFADGPPEKAAFYDNNNYQDFHALVPVCAPEELYWQQVEQKTYTAIREERKKREHAAREKAEYKAKMKDEMRRKTRLSFLQSQARTIFTEPVEIKAGEAVSLFYNPSNTVLNGTPEVWLRHSFNRWTHALGPLPPVKMAPTGRGSHMKTSVQVPLDAYVIDAVFSDKGDDLASVYDNKGGFDYHIPVVGGISKEPPLNIVHVSVEMAPVAKVGGLADVVTSLSRAVQELGHSSQVILPKYDCLKYDQVRELHEQEGFLWGGTRIRVWNGKVEGLDVHFLEPENGMFWAGCIYGRRDDGHRFGFFCHAALEFLLRSGRHPDIIHCHDWSTAPVASLFQESYKHYGLSNARIVFTIHNMEFGLAQIGKAMANANMATTVSDTYAKEVSGNAAISPHIYKFHGIRNGIDLEIWDPFDDPHIPVSYTSKQVLEGKKAAKRELQHKLGLEQVDRPLVGIITRLTAQKGIHLIKHAIWRTLDRSGQVVLLGSAPDPRVQNDFINFSNQLRSSHGNSARLCLTYDEPLSHLIYAGADFILVPSIFEPCGLTQLIAMRYGAIPVVRRTGGLNDTVFDVDHDKERAEAQGVDPNGFSFDGTDAAGVDYALNRAISAWYEARDWFNTLCGKVMEQDWSWNKPALDYVELYYGAKKR